MAVPRRDKTQSKEAVDKVLESIVRKPTVTVEPVAAGMTRSGQATTARNKSTVARMMLIEGATNEEVTEVLNTEFGFQANHKTYPAWYRSQLTKTGALTGALATHPKTGGTSMATRMTKPQTIQEMTDDLSAQLVTLHERLKDLKAQRGGLASAQTACCAAMGLKTKEEQATSPIYAQLAAVDNALADTQGELNDIKVKHAAMVVALKAYDAEMAPPAEKSKAAPKKKTTLKVVAPTPREDESVETPTHEDEVGDPAVAEG